MAVARTNKVDEDDGIEDEAPDKEEHKGKDAWDEDDAEALPEAPKAGQGLEASGWRGAGKSQAKGQHMYWLVVQYMYLVGSLTQVGLEVGGIQAQHESNGDTNGRQLPQVLATKLGQNVTSELMRARLT